MCDRVVSEALAASRGIVAGATAATYELRAFLARAIRSHSDPPFCPTDRLH